MLCIPASAPLTPPLPPLPLQPIWTFCECFLFVLTGCVIRPAIDAGDASALEQVLVTLLLNARDAFADRPQTGEKRVRLSADTNAAEGTVTIIVADNAGGIAADILPRLFTPFTTTRADRGHAGLGLSICRQLLTSMRGSIAARNSESGAIFTLVLPLA